MKIKKRLKYKSTLPKADYGMDPKALSNMNKQAAEETPAQGGGMGAAMGMNIASQGLNFISSLTPQDNDDGIGMSHKASRITGAVSGGLDAAASATSSIPIVGSAIGGVSALFKMIKGAVDHKRENDKSITSRLARKEYDPTNNNTGYSFGTRATSSATPVFGGQADTIAKYGMPLYGNGGTPIYVTDQNDPRLKSYQDSLAFYNSGEYLNSKLNTGASGMVTKSQYYDALKGAQSKYLKSNNLSWQGANSSLYLKPIRQNPVDFWENDTQIRKTDYDIYKKPLQPVIYKKPEVSVPKPKFNVTIPQEEKQSMQELLGKVQYASEPTSQHEKPVESGTFNNMFTQEVKTINGKKIYKRKDTKSPWIEQYKNGGEPTMKEYQDFNNFRKTVNPDYLSPDYDLQSAFRELPIKVLEDWKRDPEKNHLPDTYKLPNHPTFSTESKYYKPGMPAGYWKGNAYIPIDRPVSNITKNPKLMGMDDPNKQKDRVNKELERNNGVKPGFALGGDPRAQANIEAEQGEAMQHSSGKIEAIGGKKHPQGGTPIKVQPSHEYIYSDSLGRDKNGNITLNEKDVVRSFADDAKAIQKKYSKREGDSIVDKTKEIELGLLKQDAEQARVAKEEIEMGKQMKKYKAKYGADLKKFGNSGYVFNQKDYIDWIKQTPEYTGSINGDKIKDLNSDEAKNVYRPMYAENIYEKYGADAYNTVASEFGKRPGGFNIGIDHGDKTTYKSPGYSFSTNVQGQSKGIAGDYGGISEPLGGGVNPNPFIGPMMPSNRLPRGGFGPYPQGQIGDEKSRAVAQGRVATDPVIKQRNGFFQDLTTGDKMQLASMLPAFGFNLGMGLRKADVEPNRKNPYENEVLSMMANRKFDPQHYLNQANLATNTAKEDIGNNSTSVGGKIANLQKLYANSLNSLGDITTKGQKMNNQYRAEEANTKNILGEANRAEANRASGITDQNKARKQQFLAKAFEQMGQGIAATGQSANQSLTNRLLAKSLSEIAPDFDIKELKDVYKDKDGYIVFRGEKYNYNPERDKLMKVGNTTTADATKSQYAPKSFSIGNFINTNKAKG